MWRRCIVYRWPESGSQDRSTELLTVNSTTNEYNVMTSVGKTEVTQEK